VGLTVNVNLSCQQLAVSGLPQRLRQITKDVGVDPQDVHLEITEIAIMNDGKLASAVLAQLKALGFKVDMDDFGTVYSWLACLHQFPIDVLKIDRSFVANLGRGCYFAALVNAIAALARNLNSVVVAEGVEDEDQVTMLQSLDCRLAQGYYFARPMPTDQVGAYLAQSATDRGRSGAAA
jgi:EAL domain-containing protein (putative c-di-GMP-specific phosphodiesterase class I)